MLGTGVLIHRFSQVKEDKAILDRMLGFWKEVRADKILYCKSLYIGS